jgi:hypothetical protein
MNKRVKLGGKALGGLALGLAVLAAPASAQAAAPGTAPAGTPTFGPKPAGATFTVSPLAGQRGSTVNFAGNGCSFEGEGGTVSVLVGADGGIPVPAAKAAADGTWTTSAKVPTDAPEGRRQVLARCVDPTGKHAWIYDESVYFVAGGKSPQVQVSSNTVSQGSSITVRGKGCLVSGSPGRLVVLDLFGGTDRLERTEAKVNADGSWKLELAVPADAVLGSNPVGAHCLAPNSGSIEVFYIPATVTVTAPATTPEAPKPTTKPHGPKAVKVTPRFTG